MRSLGGHVPGPPRTWRETSVTAAVVALVSRNVRRLTEAGLGMEPPRRRAGTALDRGAIIGLPDPR